MGISTATDAMRLYMVPGMTHCAGGDGTSNFEMIPELENWVEKGQAPNRIIASHGNPARARPLCPYPQVAVYKGSGSTDEAANFSCALRP
jgi:feruloyl esterase